MFVCILNVFCIPYESVAFWRILSDEKQVYPWGIHTRRLTPSIYKTQRVNISYTLCVRPLQFWF